MITKRLAGCSLAALITLCCAVSAQQPSDLLRIKKAPTGNDRLGAQITLQTGKGANIQNVILGTSTDVYDLLGHAEVESFTETPYVDPVEFPNGAMEHHLKFLPQTLARGQEFFGLVGYGTDPGEPAFTEDHFRNELCRDYEVEVDGVAVRGDELELAPTFSIDTEAGPISVTIFNLTQKLLTKGTHRVIYRNTLRTTLGDCAVDCDPAGRWIWEFTINVTSSGAAKTESVASTIRPRRFPRLPEGVRALTQVEPR